MRIYNEPIQVLCGEQPQQFIWRGRLLLVKQVQARTRRCVQWWSSPTVRASRGEECEPASEDLLAEHEVWRVEAGNGAHRGVYELAHTVDGDDWVMRAVCD